MHGGEDDGGDDEGPPFEEVEGRLAGGAAANRDLHRARREADEADGVDEVADQAVGVGAAEAVVPVAEEDEGQALRCGAAVEGDEDGGWVEGQHEALGG